MFSPYYIANKSVYDLKAYKKKNPFGTVDFIITMRKSLVEQISSYDEKIVKLNEEIRQANTDCNIRADYKLEKLKERLNRHSERYYRIEQKLTNSIRDSQVNDYYDEDYEYNEDEFTDENHETDPTFEHVASSFRRDTEVGLVVREELAKLGPSSLIEKSKNINANDTSLIKIEVSNRDSSTQRDSKLTSKLKYEHFLDYFASELRSKDLLYIIDEKATTSHNNDSETREKDTF